jgi:hypothetical protein
MPEGCEGGCHIVVYGCQKTPPILLDCVVWMHYVKVVNGFFPKMGAKGTIAGLHLYVFQFAFTSSILFNNSITIPNILNIPITTRADTLSELLALVIRINITNITNINRIAETMAPIQTILT